LTKSDLDEDTSSGLDYMTYGLYVYIFLYVITGLSFLSWSYDPGRDLTGFICFISLVGFGGAVLFLAGIYKIYEGADRFSQAHKNKVNIGVALIVIGFLANLANPSIQAGSVEQLQRSVILQGSASLITQICYALAPVLLIYELVKESTKKYLYAGSSSIILISLGRLIWSLHFVDTGAELETLLLHILRMLSVMMILLAGGYFLLALGYRRPERHQTTKKVDKDTTASEKEGDEDVYEVKESDRSGIEDPEDR